MSFDAISDFLRRVSQNPALKDKVQAALDDRGEAAVFEIVEIGKEAGCDFTATEFRDYLASEPDAEIPDGELSPDQLEAVVGGLRYLRIADLSGLRKIRTMSLDKLRARRMNDLRI